MFWPVVSGKSAVTSNSEQNLRGEILLRLCDPEDEGSVAFRNFKNH